MLVWDDDRVRRPKSPRAPMTIAATLTAASSVSDAKWAHRSVVLVRMRSSLARCRQANRRLLGSCPRARTAGGLNRPATVQLAKDGFRCQRTFQLLHRNGVSWVGSCHDSDRATNDGFARPLKIFGSSPSDPEAAIAGGKCGAVGHKIRAAAAPYCI